METKRLTLRHFIKSDSASCFEGWGQDKELGKYIISYPMKNVQQMDHYIEGLLSMNTRGLLPIKQQVKQLAM